MLTSYRIVKAKYVTRNVVAAFDGEGARLYGGRWNSPGTPLVYTSQSIALAALEMLVHLQNSTVLPSYVVCAVHFQPSWVEKLTAASLPKNWRNYPAPSGLQTLGDSWAKSRSSLILCVPSAVVPGELNFLINPLHSHFSRLQFDEPQPFEFDSRLL